MVKLEAYRQAKKSNMALESMAVAGSLAAVLRPRGLLRRNSRGTKDKACAIAKEKPLLMAGAGLLDLGEKLHNHTNLMGWRLTSSHVYQLSCRALSS